MNVIDIQSYHLYSFVVYCITILYIVLHCIAILYIVVQQMIGHKATKRKKGILTRSKNFKALFRYHSHPLSHSLSLIISEFGYFLVFGIVCFVDLNQTFVCNNPNRIVIKSINRNRYDPFPKSDSLCIW